VPEDLSWAGSNAMVAGAFDRAYSAVEGAGVRAVPRTVRDGRSAGIGRSWVGEAVAGLPEANRAAGRLTVIVAPVSVETKELAI